MKNNKLFWYEGFFYLAIINFGIFAIFALYLGGDAVNGKIYNGHYFLGNHGRYTEVAKIVFDYSKWHVYSVWLTMPIAIVSRILFDRNKVKK
jgi:hypothetical protein